MHLLRVLKSERDVAAAFVQYCKRHRVLTRGMAKVGMTPRGLRGLIATKRIPANETCVVASTDAAISVISAVADPNFTSLFSDEVQYLMLHDPQVLFGRVGKSSLRFSQLVPALYMTCAVVDPVEVNWGGVRQYLDFLPRHEGNFVQLRHNLAPVIDKDPLAGQCQNAIASHFRVSEAEVRQVLLWCLTMLFSRQAIVDHKATLLRVLEKNPAFRHVYDADPGPMVAQPLPMLLPMIDMCNYSPAENVAPMAADHFVGAGPGAVAVNAVCLRSLREIQEGEELTMAYGANERELQVLFGMPKIL